MIQTGKNYFTQEQITKLRENLYVKNVSEKAITYTDEFKQLFYSEYKNGKPPSIILREMGFDPHVLGRRRINNFVRSVKKYEIRQEDFKDLRKGNSGRPQTDLTPEERIVRLEHQIKYLKQENEFLKKIDFLDRQAQLKFTQSQKRNSK